MSTTAAALPHHPEQQPDEIYLGNTDPKTLRDCRWQTSRFGTLPLKSNGSPMDPHSAKILKPWFIKTAEVQRALDHEKSRTSGLHSRSQSGVCAIAVAALEQLITDRAIRI